MLRVDLRAPEGAPTAFRAAFDLAGGSVLALHGPSGAGKTTLLRAVAGLVAAEGTLSLHGDDFRRLPSWRRPIGWVPQRQGLVPHWTPERHLRSLGPSLSCDLEAALDRLDLLRLRARPVRQLSFGERQRLALGRAVFAGKPLLLLDEPFSALDAASRRSMGELLLEQVAKGKTCAILATHDLHEVQRLCDRLCLIADLQPVAQGPTQSLLRRPPGRIAAELLGYRLLQDGLAAHPAQAAWQAAAGRVAVAGVVERSVPQDFGWRLELRDAAGRTFAADWHGEGEPPAAGQALQVFFPDLRLAQSGDGV